MNQDDLEHLLRATLAEDAEAYPVAPGALGRLQQRTRDQRPARQRRTRRVFAGGVAGLAVAAVAAVAVVALPASEHRPSTPTVIREGATSTPPAPEVSAPPAAATGQRQVRLSFSAERILLGGPDSWIFGMNAAHRSRVSKVTSGVVRVTATLPKPVCSASIDNSGVIAVVYADGQLNADGSPDCRQRGTLGLLNASTLQPVPGSVPARGGDVLVRPEGIYVVDAGVVRLLDSSTLDVIRTSNHIGSAKSIVNLAADPGQSVLFATVLDAGHPTRLEQLAEPSLAVQHATNLTAPGGALPYATAAGRAWVSLVPSDPDAASFEELYDAAGAKVTTAFEGLPYKASYAESGTQLWALSSDGSLSCASLTTGGIEGSSPVGVAGNIGADRTTVYVAVAGRDELDLITPSATCS